MLMISNEHVQQMFAWAKEHHPIEACGVIVAKKGDPSETRFVPMHNMAEAEDFYQFDPKEQFRLWKDMDEQDEYPWIIFHSHTSSEAYPSRTDVGFASEPDSHYVILSTDDRVEESLRSFRFFAQKVVEESVRIKN